MKKFRLVANVPYVRPIGVVVQIACLAMTGTTKRADLERGEFARILNRSFAGRFGVCTSRTVAGFTMNAGLTRLNLEVLGECYRTGRVTAETAQRGFRRIERPINQICIAGVTRRKP